MADARARSGRVILSIVDQLTRGCVRRLDPRTAQAWSEQLDPHAFEPDDPDRLDLYVLPSEIGATLKRAQ